MPTIYPSIVSYVGIGVQSALGTPAASPTFALPVTRASTALDWEENNQEQDTATGDYFTETDEIPNNPGARGQFVMPFVPTGINAFLALCCMAGGALIPGVPFTAFIGRGVSEDQFVDCYFSGTAQMQVAQGQAANWTIPIIGLQPPVDAAARSASAIAALLPAPERAYRLKDLQPATLIGSATVNRFNSVIWRIISQQTAYFGSRGDGVDAASDTFLDKLAAEVEFERAYNSKTEKTAFLAACGTDGALSFALQQNCGTTHSHTFALPRGRYKNRTNANADNAPIDERMVARGLRVPGGFPSPATLTIL